MYIFCSVILIGRMYFCRYYQGFIVWLIAENNSIAWSFFSLLGISPYKGSPPNDGKYLSISEIYEKKDNLDTHSALS